jgi:hypothetical protein
MAPGERDPASHIRHVVRMGPKYPAGYSARAETVAVSAATGRHLVGAAACAFETPALEPRSYPQ